MRGIYIKVEKYEDFYNKDMMDSNQSERLNWYNSLSKEQIINVLEKFVTNKIIKENIK